jgi:hypothetical protein
VSDWLCIRVVLSSGAGAALAHQPGRIMLVQSDHTFAELSEAIDIAFGRWDLSPSHLFEVEGRRLLSPEAAADPNEDAEDSDELTVGEAGLRLGARFRYQFDLGEQWEHECTVEEVDVDPYELQGDEPDQPVPVYGWGHLPDQYGRLRPDDDEREEAPQPVLSEHASWQVVAEALEGVDCPRPDNELAAAATKIRNETRSETWPHNVLLAAGGLAVNTLPDDDEELWLRLASGVVSPREPLPLEPEDEAGWAALEPADWAGAVIELVRAGAGQPADADALVELIAGCPEVEVDDWAAADEELLAQGLDTVAQMWEALGAIDGQQCLTQLGCWGLPEALERAWTGD